MTFVPRDEAHVICKAIVPACVEGPDTWEHSRWCNVTMEAMSRAYAAGASSRDGEVAALRGLLEQAVKYVTEDRATTPGVTRLARWTDKARAFLSARPATATGEATGACPGHCAPPGEACAAPCARRPGHEGRHSCKPDPAPTAAPGEPAPPAQWRYVGRGLCDGCKQPDAPVYERDGDMRNHRCRSCVFRYVEAGEPLKPAPREVPGSVFGGVDMSSNCKRPCDRPGCKDPCVRPVLHDGWCSCADHATTKDAASEPPTAPLVSEPETRGLGCKGYQSTADWPLCRKCSKESGIRRRYAGRDNRAACAVCGRSTSFLSYRPLADSETSAVIRCACPSCGGHDSGSCEHCPCAKLPPIPAPSPSLDTEGREAARSRTTTWELTEGPLDCEEDESEDNPAGFWLGNQETNQVFILPEDMGTVASLFLDVNGRDIAEAVRQAKREAFEEAAEVVLDAQDNWRTTARVPEPSIGHGPGENDIAREEDIVRAALRLVARMIRSRTAEGETPKGTP